MENLDKIVEIYKYLKKKGDFLAINDLSLLLQDEFINDFMEAENLFYLNYKNAEEEFQNNFDTEYDFSNELVLMKGDVKVESPIMDYDKLLFFLNADDVSINKDLCELFISNEYSCTFLNLIIAKTNA